jgi:GT2 family glycosyltransferase
MEKVKKLKSCTIVVTRYGETNKLLNPCLNALSKQEKCECTILFLDQKIDKETEKICKELSTEKITFIYKNIPAISLVYARNFGINIAKTNLIFFIDADAIPNKDWAYELCKTFEIDPKIGIVGGKSDPLWLSKPKWYNKSNIARDVYSLLDLGNKTKETEKVIGVCFAIDKKRLGNLAKFDEKFSRKKGILISGDDTALCRKIRKQGLLVYYTPFAKVMHQIQKERISLKWLIKRFFYGGYSKAILGGLPKTYSTKRNVFDWLIIPIIAIPYILGNLKARIENEK